MNTKSKTSLLRFLLAVIVAMIVAIYWYEDLRYSLPTKKPVGLAEVPLGERIDLPAEVASELSFKRPALIHFFNPDCPCSRFNLAHLAKLVGAFREHVSFVVAAEAEDKGDVAERLADHGLALPIVLDHSAAVAHAFGVFSTPQAVILDGDHHLYYRGNYNSARFHTHKSSEYARLALESLLKGATLAGISLPPKAFRAWGCNLPGDELAELEEL